MSSVRMHPFRTGALVLLVSLMSGCATVIQSQNQTVFVDTREASTSGGSAVTGASCKLNNDKGEWTVETPSTVSIAKSAADLFIRCILYGYEDGSAVAISRVHGAIFGNILLGGVIGAAIDHTQGTGYNYPDTLTIEMGLHKTIDLQDGQAITTSSEPKQPDGDGGPAGGRTSATVEDFKDLLPSQ